jgi:hypothetical protein
LKKQAFWTYFPLILGKGGVRNRSTKGHKKIAERRFLFNKARTPILGKNKFVSQLVEPKVSEVDIERFESLF